MSRPISPYAVLELRPGNGEMPPPGSSTGSRKAPIRPNSLADLLQRLDRGEIAWFSIPPIEGDACGAALVRSRAKSLGLTNPVTSYLDIDGNRIVSLKKE